MVVQVAGRGEGGVAVGLAQDRRDHLRDGGLAAVSYTHLTLPTSALV